MASLIIRNVDPAIKERVRVRAAKSGRSMEAELRAIVTDAVGAAAPSEVNLAEAIRRRFAPFGGVDDLEIQPRVPLGEPTRFGGPVAQSGKRNALARGQPGAQAGQVSAIW